MDQMRGQVPQQERPFPEPLMNQSEVQHLEVPQAAVDELARLAGRAGRPILRLHQPYRQAAGHGVKGRAGAGYASPDHEHIKRSAGQAGQVAIPSGGRKLAWLFAAFSVQQARPRKPRGPPSTGRPQLFEQPGPF